MVNRDPVLYVNGRLKMYQKWAFKNVPLLKILFPFFKKGIGVSRGAKRPLVLCSGITVELFTSPSPSV
jgi:hypothetical protein